MSLRRGACLGSEKTAGVRHEHSWPVARLVRGRFGWSAWGIFLGLPGARTRRHLHTSLLTSGAVRALQAVLMTGQSLRFPQVGVALLLMLDKSWQKKLPHDDTGAASGSRTA